MMFADDIVLCSELKEQIEGNLERCWNGLESRGMRISGSKTEHMGMDEKNRDTIMLHNEEMKTVDEFKYLGWSENCGSEV